MSGQGREARLRERLPGGKLVPEFVETANGGMPSTEEYEAIKKGEVKQSRTLPGVGVVRFVSYRFGRVGPTQRYAIIRALDRDFPAPATHTRFIIESFSGYEGAVAALTMAIEWMAELARMYGDPAAVDPAVEDLLRALEENAEPAEENAERGPSA
jgi:hypothetical protein